MKLQISLPPEAWQQVIQLADAERRPPRYQVGHLVIEALRARKADQIVSEEEEPANAH
jgi:hypothetical protein